MARAPAIAVIDIGKSNGKLALVDAVTRDVIDIRTTANTVATAGIYPHYDVDRLWQWLLAGLAEFSGEAEIGAISVTTHGACFAVMAGERLALPVIDYEFATLEEIHAEYARLRGDFSETLSPDLPNGLNAGRQLYWLSRRYPETFALADAILPYPQYWVARLTGEKVAETTSLGCHTDLWNPRAGTYSGLVDSQGWRDLFPPIVKAWETVGAIRSEVAEATGLALGTRVVAGIHDSNASLFPHLLTRPRPFAVLSTGTWMVVFAPGGNLDRLDRDRDCLANVDAFGHAIPSARFMAGREYEIIAGGDAKPSDADVARVISDRIMALPTFAPGTGPYPGGTGRWSHDPATLTSGERAAVASLYAASTTETCLALAGADGPVIVEGPLAGNAIFLGALAQRIGRPVIAEPDATGTTQGAALLVEGPDSRPPLIDRPPVVPLAIDLSGYAATWREGAAA